MEGEEGRIVARLDPASKVAEGQDAELWVDATRLQLFDPEDGRNLTSDQKGPAAVGGQSPQGEPEEASTEGEAPQGGATGGAV